MPLKMDSNKNLRQYRHQRIRNKVKGTLARLRLNVFRSSNNICAQVIDDTVGKTIVSATTAEVEFRKGGSKRPLVEAFEIGKLIAQRAVEKGVDKVVFDRGGFQYHGRVKALADGAREGGLQF